MGVEEKRKRKPTQLYDAGDDGEYSAFGVPSRLSDLDDHYGARPPRRERNDSDHGLSTGCEVLILKPGPLDNQTGVVQSMHNGYFQVLTEGGEHVNLRAKECQVLAQGITRGMPRPVKSMAPAVNEYNAPYNPAAYEPTSIVPSALPIAPYRSSLNAHNRYDGTIFGGSGGVVRHGANGRVYTSVVKARRVTDIDVGHPVTVWNGKVHAGANGKVVAT
jgi:hypothetical protein